MAATIQSVKARQIFDSRGNPTVEVDVCCSDGTFARAAVPSGASTGVYEALELRDGGSDYLGKGVLKAVDNVNSIIGPALIGKDPTKQTDLDNYMIHELDGTQNEWGWCKQKLGANAILAVSLAVCKAGASVKKIPLYQHIANLAGNKHLVLPVPAFNVINGGSHAGNKLAMQGLMILPTGASSFREAMKMGVEVYDFLKSLIKERYGQHATNVGAEGGFAPNIQEDREGLELLKEAIGMAGYTREVVIGIDAAASKFYSEKDNTYDLNFKEVNNDGSQKISGDRLKNMYVSLASQYQVASIEDPFDMNDWLHYGKFTQDDAVRIQIVGDDLLKANLTKIAKAIAEKSCNAVLLKVNKIGSVSESIEVVRMSQDAGFSVVISHRSGEIEDSFIADFAVGLSTGQIKTGAPCGSEHVAKYNQLLRIEEELGADAHYAGINFRSPCWEARLSDLIFNDDDDADLLFNSHDFDLDITAPYAPDDTQQRVEDNQSSRAATMSTGHDDMSNFVLERSDEPVPDRPFGLVDDSGSEDEEYVYIARTDTEAPELPERNIGTHLLITEAGEDRGITGVGGRGRAAGARNERRTSGSEILKLPADFNGDAPLQESKRFKIESAKLLREAVNKCKDWLPSILLAALLYNANIFAVDGSTLDELDFKESGAVLVLSNTELSNFETSQDSYSSRCPSVILKEHIPAERRFGEIKIRSYHFGGDLWRRKRFSLVNNDDFHVLQWLPVERPKSVVKPVRCIDKYSLESCADRLLDLEGLTEDEKSSAADLMKCKDNRVLFVTLGRNPGVQLSWLKKQIAKN